MIEIDLSRDNNLTDFAKNLLKDFYLKAGETSPQEAFARAAWAFSGGDIELARRMYDYVSKGWLSFSSPVLSNAPSYDKHTNTFEKVRAMPISCFLSHVPDTIEGQVGAASELAALSVVGGGVGLHMKMRGITKKSPGVIPYAKTADSNIMYYKQADTRKGSVALYLDIDHPDVEEFITIRVPTGGDINRKCLNIHNAINITDAFMEAVRNDWQWDLRCPNSGKVTATLRARSLWESILETRARTGEPYLNFIDEANRKLPANLKEQGLVIHGSNLCNEIHLPTNEEMTAVCCLSSVNLEYYDEWKETTMVQDLTEFLDNVLSYFIANAPVTLSKAVAAAKHTRDIGIGAMGFHSYLQKHLIPFESGGMNSASQLSHIMFKYIKEQAVIASERLAKERGEPEGMKGTGRRNAHLLAIAPNANSSIIAGCSASIEPLHANIYAHRTRLGTVMVRNKYLEKVLADYYPSTMIEDVWKSVAKNKGSVQHLPELPDNIKAVFKTAFEIDQRWVVNHARLRQVHICQGQSVNLFLPAGSEKSYVNKVHLAAFDTSPNAPGAPLKGLYYYRTTKERTIEKVDTTVVRNKLTNFEEQECLSCHA